MKSRSARAWRQSGAESCASRGANAARGRAAGSAATCGIWPSFDPESLERNPHLADLAGHIAESAVGAYFGGVPHLDVAHFPERPTEPEVDFILTIGEKRIPVEVK